MFKWLLIILVVLIGGWTFGRASIPPKILNSTGGRIADAGTFTMRYKALHGKHPPASKNNIIMADSSRLKQLLDSVAASDAGTVIFFYDSNMLVSRYLLYDINNLARQYGPKGIQFFVVAFDDNTDKVGYALDVLGRLYFHPIMTPASNLTDSSYFFARHNIKFTELPVAVYKSLNGRTYNMMTVDIKLGNSLEDLIKQDVR